MILIYSSKERAFTKETNYLLQAEEVFQFCLRLNRKYQLKIFNKWPNVGGYRVIEGEELMLLKNEINLLIGKSEEIGNSMDIPQVIGNHDFGQDEYFDKVKPFGLLGLISFLEELLRFVNQAISKDEKLYFIGD